MKGVIKLYTEKGYPFIKYNDSEMFGDSDALLNVNILELNETLASERWQGNSNNSPKASSPQIRQFILEKVF